MDKKAFVLSALFLFAMWFHGGCYLWSESDTYYGLEAEGEEILFLVDVSGSMQGRDEGVTPRGRMSTRARDEAITRGTSAMPGGCTGGRASSRVSDRADEETTALGAARRELIPVIRGLDENTRFNILLFGGSVEEWKPQTVYATEENRDEAIDYVEDLEASGATPAHEVLDRAFDENADIIFFLSDGVPTDARPQEILDDVQEWNAGGQVIVHAIGLGDHLDDVFMDKLARQNNGEFVHR